MSVIGTSSALSFLSRLSAQVRGLLRVGIDSVLPPRCPGSGEVVTEPGALAPAFWQELTFIAPPSCACCGMPFALDLATRPEDEILCASCLATPFEFDRARACVTYTDASRKLILGFKYGDRLHAITTFTPWMLRAGAELIATSDIIIPVPLHRRRLWQRRFNQSALLAQALARATHLPCLPMGLTRTRHTPPQKGLSRNERLRNVATAFAVTPRHSTHIEGKRILLIDDVFTSGATLNACARALKRSGAATVNVLTIARVTREDFS